jgi:hypothetical protein
VKSVIHAYINKTQLTFVISDSDTISYEMHSYYYRKQTETTHLYMTLLPNIVKPVFTVFNPGESSSNAAI